MLPLLSKRAAVRLSFEQKNSIQKFKTHQKKADYAFEISSEGELEQVYPLLEDFLKAGYCVEIVYCSASVEHRIKELETEFPGQVRSYILPILSFFPFSSESNSARWLSAQTFFMCRYDFFPELIHYGSKKSVDFILLSASLGDFGRKSKLSRSYLKSCFSQFDKIVAVSDRQKEQITGSMEVELERIKIFDFRTLQIQKRLDAYQNTLYKKWPLFQNFEVPKSSIVFGSFWNHDFELVMKTVAAKKNVTLVPHNLSVANMEELNSLLVGQDIDFKILDENSLLEDFRATQVTILNMKGILCELYPLFDICYIGGGFGSSIHSVLEPYMAGCFVVTGPKTHRSAEFDMISDYDPDRIKRKSTYAEIVKVMQIDNNNKDRVEQFNLQFQKDYPELKEWLVKC